MVGGQVSIACTGATIVLRIAQPDDGWRVEVGQSGPAGFQVQVFFRRFDANAVDRTEVRAVCEDGTPAFTVKNKK